MAQRDQLDQALEDLAQALGNTISILSILRDLRRNADRLLVPFRDQLSVVRDAIDATMRSLS
jgi:ABC-type transporter Mla subunit MlaD